jgi:L-asparaginase/Glu-tRNA(Gln) amidotransferase subunit D
MMIGAVRRPCGANLRRTAQGETMAKYFRNLAAAVLVSGLACNVSCWAQQAITQELPLVWVLSTGGTIAGTGASPTNVAEYRGGTVLGEDLVKAVPEIKQFVR